MHAAWTPTSPTFRVMSLFHNLLGGSHFNRKQKKMVHVVPPLCVLFALTAVCGSHVENQPKASAANRRVCFVLLL